MIRPRGRARSLRQILHRSSLAHSLATVLIVGVAMGVPAVVTLRLNEARGLALIARSVAGTEEAAVVFQDGEAASEALVPFIATGQISKLAVLGRDGRVIASWHDRSGGADAVLGRMVQSLLGSSAISEPVMHDGLVVGRVELVGDGRTLLRLLAVTFAVIALCQLVTAIAAIFISGRVLRRITGPLQHLVDVTTRVQRDRAFERRVPRTDIVELDRLGHAFNGLLAELQSWRSGMEQERARLSHQATHDALTGLPNRSFFEGRLHRALAHAESSGGRMGVILVDCDRFKEVNDTYGHATGDAVLIAVAARLRGQVRAQDLVARLGGDEFAILIAPVGEMAALRRIADKICDVMEVPVAFDSARIAARISAGIAIFPDDATTAAAILHHADGDMYRRKRQMGAGLPEPVPRKNPVSGPPPQPAPHEKRSDAG